MTAGGGDPTGSSHSLTVGETARQRDLLLFCRQLGVMLNAGTDILRALSVVQDQISQQAIRQAIETARNDMTLGSTLARSLGRFPGIFDPFFVDMVRQGEGEGTLGDVLQSLADYQEKDVHFNALAPLVSREVSTPTGDGYSRRQDESLSSRGVHRLAVWLGGGVALAAVAWGILVSMGLSVPGAATAWALLGLAVAGWGRAELTPGIANATLAEVTAEPRAGVERHLQPVGDREPPAPEANQRPARDLHRGTMTTPPSVQTHSPPVQSRSQGETGPHADGGGQAPETSPRSKKPVPPPPQDGSAPPGGRARRNLPL